MNLNDLEFKAEDFACSCLPEFNCKGDQCVAHRQGMATIVNHILRERLEKAPNLQGRLMGDHFQPLCVHSMIYEHAVTHTARLVCIEEIKNGEGT